jgi:hypothetical protein
MVLQLTWFFSFIESVLKLLIESAVEIYFEALHFSYMTSLLIESVVEIYFQALNFSSKYNA